MISAALYTEGHGIHLTSDMLKRPIEDFMNEYPNITAQHPIVNDIFNYHQTVWEHAAGHYLYATGAILLSWSHAWIFRFEVNPELSNVELIGFFTGSVIYSVNVTGVAIEFPDGTIVGLIFLLTYGVGLGVFTFKTGNLFSRGKRVVLQFYILSYAISLICIIIYIGVEGGFKSRT